MASVSESASWNVPVPLDDHRTAPYEVAVAPCVTKTDVSVSHIPIVGPAWAVGVPYTVTEVTLFSVKVVVQPADVIAVMVTVVVPIFSKGVVIETESFPSTIEMGVDNVAEVAPLSV